MNSLIRLITAALRSRNVHVRVNVRNNKMSVYFRKRDYVLITVRPGGDVDITTVGLSNYPFSPNDFDILREAADVFGALYRLSQ